MTIILCKLKTIEPDGLNTKHGMFAKLFYNDYQMLLHFIFYFHLVYSIVFFHYCSFFYFYFGAMVISITRGFQIRDLG